MPPTTSVAEALDEVQYPYPVGRVFRAWTASALNGALDPLP